MSRWTTRIALENMKSEFKMMHFILFWISFYSEFDNNKSFKNDLKPDSIKDVLVNLVWVLWIL